MLVHLKNKVEITSSKSLTMFNTNSLSLIIMFSLFSNTGSAKSVSYPNLFENNVTSENYEIIKLIDGKINGILYHADKKQIIIDAGHHTWKVNNQGRLIDALEGYGSWNSSGYYFNPEFYLDWIETGDKQEKLFTQRIDGNAYSDQQLFNVFNQADVVEFSIAAHNTYAYLLSENNSTIIDISTKRNLVHYSCGDDSYRDLKWNQTCFEGYIKPYQDPINLLESSLHGSQETDDPLSPLRVKGFNKRKYYFEEGIGLQIIAPFVFPFIGGTWNNLPDRYWFGDALIDLVHNNETLSFRVFADKQIKDNTNKRKVNFDNFTIYDFPEQPNVKILTLSYLSYRFSGTEKNLNDYYEDNVGLYVLRKKTQASPAGKHPQPWFINVVGLESNREIWGNINFTDSTINYQYYQLGERGKHLDLVLNSAAAAPQAFYYFPESFTVNVQSKHYKSVFKLQINQQKTAWFHNPLDYTDLPLTINLNPQELKSAVVQLTTNHSKNREKSPLILQVRFEENTDISSNLSVSLALTDKAIQLTKFNVEFPLQSSVNIERAKLKQVHQKVLNNQQPLQALFTQVQLLAETDEYTKNYIPFVTQYIAEQINKHNQVENFFGSLEILTFYIEHILPFINHKTAEHNILYNHSVIASQALVAAIHNEQEDMVTVVFRTLLGPNFDITIQENATLVYNLACYYALQKNKPKLLIASKRSRQLGKPADQFIKDSNFSSYIQDTQFLHIINSEYD
jgi:hypothetical protein